MGASLRNFQTGTYICWGLSSLPGNCSPVRQYNTRDEYIRPALESLLCFIKDLSSGIDVNNVWLIQRFVLITYKLSKLVHVDIAYH